MKNKNRISIDCLVSEELYKVWQDIGQDIPASSKLKILLNDKIKINKQKIEKEL